MNHDVRIYYWGNLRGQPCKSNAITKGVMTHSLRMISLSRGMLCSMRLVSRRFSSIGVLPILDFYTTWVSCHPSEWLCPCLLMWPHYHGQLRALKELPTELENLVFLFGIFRNSLILTGISSSLLLAFWEQLSWLHWPLVSVTFGNQRSRWIDGLWMQGWLEESRSYYPESVSSNLQQQLQMEKSQVQYVVEKLRQETKKVLGNGSCSSITWMNWKSSVRKKSESSVTSRPRSIR